MDIKGSVLFLVLLSVYLSVAVQDEPINCNRYLDYIIRDWYCKPDGLFQVPQDRLVDDVVTRDELLSEIGSRCSNDALKTIYIDCIVNEFAQCPAQVDDVIDSIREKMDMFCDGKKGSQWITSVLKNGFSFNVTCAGVAEQAVLECVEILNINAEIVGSNTSFATASEIVPPIVSAMYRCMKTRLAIMPDTMNTCGSSWQDILLEYWLQMSAMGGTFVTLSNEDRQTLLTIKNGS